MSKHLAMIGSAGHFFNLMECLEELLVDIFNVDLILFYCRGDTNTFNFYKRYVTEKDWNSIQYIHLMNADEIFYFNVKSLLNYNSIVRKIKLSDYNYVIASQYEVNYQLHLINSINYNSLIALDEGNAVFNVVEKRKKTLNEGRTISLISKVLRFKMKEPKKITFFTSYDLDLLPQDESIKCNYLYSKKKLTNKKIIENSISFIGSPLLEDNLMEEDSYYKYIDFITQKFNGYKIVYHPHRREIQDRLDILSSDFGFIIEKLDSSIELDFINRESIPKVIAGFFTNGIFNIKKISNGILNLKFISFKVDTKKLNVKDYTLYDDIYEIYADQGIECIECE